MSATHPTIFRWLPLLAVASMAALGCPEARWSVLTDSFDRVLLSAWGPDEKDVFVAGGGLGNGATGVLLHLRGGRWVVRDVGVPDTFWWIFGFAADDVFLVGERGMAYHFDGAALERMPTPTTATLYGIWGATRDEMWAVGGSPQANGPNDVILRYDGSSWTLVPPQEALGLAYFKVWGTARDDAYIVGQNGVVLRYDGSAWSRQATPARATLLTVFGRGPGDVFAVGGPPATFIRFDGAAWSNVELPGLASGLTGVSANRRGDLFVDGLAGTKWRLAEGRWTDFSDDPPGQDLHAVWAAPDGSAFAVGGNFVAAGGPGMVRKGVIATFGTSKVAAP